MTAQDVMALLGWSMVINYGIFLIWFLALKLMPDLTYRMQSLVMTIGRDEFNRVMYKLMGQFKILMLVTHIGPYVAMRIVYG